MASRLRGMTCLSATIIPRVQRLLETGVVKERPLWLDVVEAYPPLVPPALPPSQITGRAPVIKYPYEPAKRDEIKSIAKGPTATLPLSLFESKSVKRVKQWSCDTVPSLDTQTQAEEVSAEERPPKQLIPGLTVRASEPAEEPSISETSAKTKRDSQYYYADPGQESHLDDKLKELQAILKNYE